MANDVSTNISLPSGWIAKTSRKYPDKFYYFNKNTGVSTWECPKLGPPQKFRHSLDSSTKSSKTANKRSSDVAFPQEENKLESKGGKLRTSVENKIAYNQNGGHSFCDDTECNNLNTKRLVHQIPQPNSNNDCSKPITSLEKSTQSNNGKKKKKRRKPKTKIKDLLSNNTVIDSNNCEIKTCEISKTNHSSPLNKNNTLLQSNQNSHQSVICDNILRRSNPKSPQSTISDNILFQFKKQISCQSVISETNLSNNPPEDIEMLDLTKNLTRINDIPADQDASYFIVVDTNIFIAELNIIDEIKDMPINNCGPPHFFIPWVVIQELDNLRMKSPKISKVFKGASKAVKYVNEVIKAKHPRFHGQSPKEMKEWAQAFSKNNDDRILECCLNLVDRMSPEKVILLTNDINLSNKALIINITVFDFKSFLKHINFSNNNVFNNLKTQEQCNAVEKPLVLQNSAVSIVKEDSQQKKIDEIMIKVRQLLKDVLYTFFAAEMFEAYGEIWKKFKIEVNLLNGILNGIDKYWKTVFSFHFSMEDKRNFEFLHDIAKRPEGFNCSKEECFSILNAIQELFCSIKKQWPKIEVPVTQIQELITFLKDPPKTEVIHIQNDELKVENYKVTLNVFDYIWSVINHLCGMVMDFYGIQHNFSYERPAAFPSSTDFNFLMCRLHPAVQRIKLLMSKIVIKNESDEPLDLNIFRTFHQVLLECIPSLAIEIRPPDTQNFTVEALQHFCQSEENEEKILLGYKQLETFYIKLEEVLISMTISQKKICYNM